LTIDLDNDYTEKDLEDEVILLEDEDLWEDEDE
jgi:hypothetical protein